MDPTPEPLMEGRPPLLSCRERILLLTVHITEVFSHLHHQLRPQSEVLLDLRGPQVQVAILHPQ